MQHNNIGKSCVTRVHKVNLQFGGYEYLYEYRACRDGMKPHSKFVNQCNGIDINYKIEWTVQGQKYMHAICEDCKWILYSKIGCI